MDDAQLHRTPNSRRTSHTCWFAKDARFAREHGDGLQNLFVGDSDECAARFGDRAHSLAEVAWMSDCDGVCHSIGVAWSQAAVALPRGNERLAPIGLHPKNPGQTGNEAEEVHLLQPLPHPTNRAPVTYTNYNPVGEATRCKCPEQ